MSGRYYSAEQQTQDDFQDRFTHAEGEVVYDAKTKFGPWATMTQRSFELHGAGRLGLDYGQKYRRNSSGWLIKAEG